MPATILLPQKKAMRATKDNLAYFETQRAQLEANNLQRKIGGRRGRRASSKGCTVVLIRQAGESGQLYGSVSARDIADAVTAAGFTVDRQQIVLDRPIKNLGLHPVRVDAAPGGRRHRHRQCRAVRGGRARCRRPASTRCAEREDDETKHAAEAEATPRPEARRVRKPRGLAFNMLVICCGIWPNSSRSAFVHDLVRCCSRVCSRALSASAGSR